MHGRSVTVSSSPKISSKVSQISDRFVCGSSRNDQQNVRNKTHEEKGDRTWCTYTPPWVGRFAPVYILKPRSPRFSGNDFRSCNFAFLLCQLWMVTFTHQASGHTSSKTNYSGFEIQSTAHCRWLNDSLSSIFACICRHLFLTDCFLFSL